MQHICLHFCSWRTGRRNEEEEMPPCGKKRRLVVVCMHEGFFFFRISSAFLTKCLQVGNENGPERSRANRNPSDGLHMAQIFLSSLHGPVTEIDSNKVKQDKRRRVGEGGGRIFHHQRSSRSAIKSKTSPELEDKQQPARAHN